MVRQELKFFCDVREGGPPAIKPLINAIQDFFIEIIENQRKQNNQRSAEIFVSNSVRIRRELFKLSYLKNEFVLN